MKIITHNMGNIDSVSNIVFLAGHERLAVPHATFMFHGVAFDFPGAVHADHPWCTDKLETINSEHKKMASIIKERAKFDTIDEITTLFSAQVTKDAQYALDHGIIQKIEHHQIPPGAKHLSSRSDPEVGWSLSGRPANPS